MKKLQKLFAILLAICMMMSLLSVNAFAGETEQQAPVYRCDLHAHDEGCYTTTQTCDKHVHGDGCADAETGEWICGKSLGLDLICETEEHQHSEADNCYHKHSIDTGCYGEPTCGLELNAPTCTIEVGSLTCPLEECKLGGLCPNSVDSSHVCSDECVPHEHTAGCHSHSDSCRHNQHSADCYHTQHSAGCYAKTPICELVEGETVECQKPVHQHAGNCYAEHTAHDAEKCYVKTLSCGKNSDHQHTQGYCVPPKDNYVAAPINHNIDVTLFNYGSYINVGADKALQFGWHNTLSAGGRPYEGIDGPARHSVTGEPFTSDAEIEDTSTETGNAKLQHIPTMKRTLVNGYPHFAEKHRAGTSREANKITNVSLAYLFPEKKGLNPGAGTLTTYDGMREKAVFTTADGYNSNYESMRFDMVGDGGLFVKDANGYYTYDSAYTSAYYDQNARRFLLSDTLIGPSHYGAAKVAYGYINYVQNFMPFNKINFDEPEQFYKVARTSDQWAYMTQYTKNGEDYADIPDLWFGMTMEFDFFVPKDGKINGKPMEFVFNGDDDVWVYIDDVLVLDIGGTHGPIEGTINFATGDVTDPNRGGSNDDVRPSYTDLETLFKNALGDKYDPNMFDENGAFVDYSKHTLKFFYMERGGNISYCKLKFNMPALPTGSLSVGKAVEDMNGNTPDFITDALSYEFRVLEADANGAATNDLFIPAGSSYKIVNANDYDDILGSGTVGADGYFTLKDGQVALFEDVFTKYAGSTANVKYVVEERIPGQFSGVYGEVEYVADNQSVSNEVESNGGTAQQYLTYVTPALASDETQKVTFTNKVKVDLTKPEEPGEEGEEVVDPMIATLCITKREAGDQAPARQETYQIRVLAGYSEETMQPLSKGAKYTVGKSEKTVKDGGIIELKADETAKLVFLEGTSYKVEEVVNSQYTYYPTYEGAEGIIAVEGTQDVAATVVNTYYVPSSGGSGNGSTTVPTDPVDPTDPENPGDTTIEDEDTPLGELPDGVEIGDEDVPLASLPESDVPLATLPEEEVPLAVLPVTGDASAIWMALSALSGAGVFLTRKKRDEE